LRRLDLKSSIKIIDARPSMPSQDFTCPKCGQSSFRLHAQLPEVDGLPEVQCLECSFCGEVVVVERVTSILQPHTSYWRERETGQ